MDKKWLMKIDAGEIERLEAERDAIEAEDNLLTAVTLARADLSDNDDTKVKEEEKSDEGEPKSDVAERGDTSDPELDF